MKKAILLSAILSLALFAIGQDYYVSFNGKDYSENDTLIIYGDPTMDTISFSANFNNGSNDGINFGVVREQIAPHGGTSNFFKWGETYDILTDTSSAYLFIPAGSNSPDGFYMGYYIPNNIVGISYVGFTFYNINVPDDKFSFLVEYNTVAYGVEENWLSNNMLHDIYPNPATNLINIDFEKNVTDPISYYITSISGKMLIDGNINPGISSIDIDVSHLRSGLYLVHLVSQEGSSITKKVLINR